MREVTIVLISNSQEDTKSNQKKSRRGSSHWFVDDWPLTLDEATTTLVLAACPVRTSVLEISESHNENENGPRVPVARAQEIKECATNL